MGRLVVWYAVYGAVVAWREKRCELAAAATCMGYATVHTKVLKCTAAALLARVPLMRKPNKRGTNRGGTL